MANLDHFHRIVRSFTSLLDELSPSWLKGDIEYVREEVGYDEYGEALENLIALGLRNGCGFTADQAKQVEDLAAAMGLKDSPWLDQLRDFRAAQRES